MESKRKKFSKNHSEVEKEAEFKIKRKEND
jgi:hypothetical protein